LKTISPAEWSIEKRRENNKYISELSEWHQLEVEKSIECNKLMRILRKCTKSRHRHHIYFKLKMKVFLSQFKDISLNSLKDPRKKWNEDMKTDVIHRKTLREGKLLIVTESDKK
jgi:hypothetical protein